MIEGRSGPSVIGAEGSLFDLERALKERFGVGVIAGLLWTSSAVTRKRTASPVIEVSVFAGSTGTAVLA